MTDDTRALVRLSAALGSGDAAARASAMARAAGAATRERAEEVLLQAYLFLGYPAVLQAFAEWRAIAGAAAAASAADEGRELWRTRGVAVCEAIYGGAYEGLRRNVAGLHPDLERWMLEEGYGKVLGRPGLGLRERELCIVALLAGLPARRQLHSHMRGALNVGATPQEVEEVLELAAIVLPAGPVAASRALWREVQERWQNRGNGREG